MIALNKDQIYQNIHNMDYHVYELNDSISREDCKTYCEMFSYDSTNN